ncbi:alpha/beta fold hydrolase [Rhizobium sp. S163]|uniref:alpha/beta hydrolase n=1 Tax=Rhizobium sp. S163 TaxID=3055039 RepID=UPI0025A9D8CC|nr:alpha/beta fold hydrolase [Rhizobium sp. S163]MDM9645743.1 alpha/beta fold hydrolase [Rhizobium sp. S163]
MRIAILFVLLVLSSCARPGPETLALVTKPAGQKTVTILVASVRVPADSPSYAFTAGRADRLRYREVTIAIPPAHKPPEIEWPKGKPDPRKSFAVVERKDLTRDQFVAAAHSNGASAQSAGIFIHGYNYNYQEALFRLAQMSADSGVSGSPILFDWPSQATITGYVADRDSAAFARDDLVSVLTDLGKSNVRTTLLAHSMGAWLAVESIRQLSLMGREDVLGKIDQVVLAAPDIDVDLLRKQLAATKPLSHPMVILASKDDLALALSKRLAGSAATAGSLDIADPRTKKLAKEENLEVIDISSLPSVGGTNHDRFAALAAVYPQLQNTGNENTVAGTGAVVLNGVGAVVSAPFRIGGTLLAH